MSRRKYYSLGYLPDKKLRSMKSEDISFDIGQIKLEIERLEGEKKFCTTYFWRRLCYENEVKRRTSQRQEWVDSLERNPYNYKRGFQYWFKPRELRDRIADEIKRVKGDIREIQDRLEQRLLTFSPKCGDFNMLPFSSIKNYESRTNDKIKFFNSTLERYNSFFQKAARRETKSSIKRAIVAQALGKSRQEAEKIKKSLVQNETCPYCFNSIDEGHFDHIYPIAKGGHSTLANMVRICSSCNLKKKDMTLAKFIQKFKLDRDMIYSRLSSLGKDF